MAGEKKTGANVRLCVVADDLVAGGGSELVAVASRHGRPCAALAAAILIPGRYEPPVAAGRVQTPPVVAGHPHSAPAAAVLIPVRSQRCGRPCANPAAAGHPAGRPHSAPAAVVHLPSLKPPTAGPSSLLSPSLAHT